MAFALSDVGRSVGAVCRVDDHLDHGELPVGYIGSAERCVELAAGWVAQVLPPAQSERLSGLADVGSSGGLLSDLVDHRWRPAFVDQAEPLNISKPRRLLAGFRAVVMAGGFGVWVVVLVDQLEHRAALLAGGVLKAAQQVGVVLVQFLDVQEVGVIGHVCAQHPLRELALVQLLDLRLCQLAVIGLRHAAEHRRPGPFCFAVWSGRLASLDLVVELRHGFLHACAALRGRMRHGGYLMLESEADKAAIYVFADDLFEINIG